MNEVVISRIKFILFPVYVILVQACKEPDHKFEVLSPDESQLSFVNKLTPTGDLNILTYLYYYNGGGVSISDFNNDGLDDIYFTCNQCSDCIFLNKGDLKFQDITNESRIENSDGWTTGVSHADINDDGLMDIYVCKVGNYRSINGRNKLYVNQGINEEGIPTFREVSSEYGLDISAFSTQSAFFDYDLDGDLDMFLLCHSVHPNRSYGKGKSRERTDSLAGDRLFENLDGKFVDVSREVGLFQGKIGYGLGLIVSDINKDGFPDIYVGNDFFENDYLYINNGGDSFSEVISSDFRKLGHTSHYSMGNGAADLNNDGLTDIVSLDMLPEELTTLKSSGGEDAFPVYNRYLSNGYSPQFMQNTLHLNRGNGIMSEVGFQSGIASTEWSWGVLCGDLDLDGYKDLFITNGILGATNDLDYIKFVVHEDVQRAIEKGDGGSILSFTDKIPEKKTPNYIFRNWGNATFQDVSDNWLGKIPTFSNGSALADLDNDGDLDIVVNNINEEAFLLKNITNDKQSSNYIRIEFKGSKGNIHGIGAKVEIYADDLYIYEENYPVKSYLSTSPNYLLSGLGSKQHIDSMRVIWPDGKTQLLTELKSNATLTLEYSRTDRMYEPNEINNAVLTNMELTLPFKHEESQTLDFDRDPLVPFALSNEGPAISIGDVNGDSLDDIFIGGAKHQKSEIFIQNTEGAFDALKNSNFEESATNEDVASLFFDADNDSDPDLIVVSGGNEFKKGEPLRPRLYFNDGGVMTYDPDAFEGIAVNGSCVKAIDIENDGDLDLVIGSDAVPQKFGETPVNFIFENIGDGTFRNISEGFGEDFSKVGNINAIEVIDIDGNGYQDLVCAGDWMPITLFINDGLKLKRVAITNSEGWWNALAVSDFDQDGDFDLIAGNWGANTRLKASVSEPVTLYRYDFDNNGSQETIVTYYYKGNETLIATKDELAKQLPVINKDFLSYSEFSKAKIQELFPSNTLEKALKKQVSTLESCLFENKGNLKFVSKPLPLSAQSSSVNDILVDDINNDGFNDLLLVGNNYEISTQLGRLDASHGVLLLNDRSGNFIESTIQSFDIAGPSRKIEKIIINGSTCYIVAINNSTPSIVKKED